MTPDKDKACSSPKDDVTDTATDREFDLNFLHAYDWRSAGHDVRKVIDLINFDCRQDPGKVTGTVQPISTESTLSDEEQMRLRRLVATNPNTPPKVLAALAREAAAGLLAKIAENPRTPPETLAALGVHQEAEVRAAVAENPHTPEDTLWRLVRDENPDVRYVLAENYHLQPEMLELLAEDDNPYVAFRARKTLDRQNSGGVVAGSFPQQSDSRSRLSSV